MYIFEYACIKSGGYIPNYYQLLSDEKIGRIKINTLILSSLIYCLAS